MIAQTGTTDAKVQAMQAKWRYVIISPVRDEAQYIETTIVSVVNQTIQPAQWIIVDDGSSDETASIAERYSSNYPWITCVRRVNRGFRSPGSGVIATFDDGYRAIGDTNWDFLIKLDGDLTLPPDYFAKCLEQFHNDPTLGIAGGTLYHLENGRRVQEPNPQFHVRGATKIYRRGCWEAIGGLLQAPGWDTIDEVKASYLGWRTRSFPNILVLHNRPTGGAMGSWSDAIKNGTADYVSGYHPLFLLAKCLKRCRQRPFVVGSIGLLWGFVRAYLRRTPRVPDAALVKYVRQQQLRQPVRHGHDLEVGTMDLRRRDGQLEFDRPGRKVHFHLVGND